MELELAKCKMDMMSLNSQLLDAIQQKLNLSQQLEAWQVRAGRTGLREAVSAGSVYGVGCWPRMTSGAAGPGCAAATSRLGTGLRSFVPLAGEKPRWEAR